MATCRSERRVKRRMAHLDWMGSMILLLVLQARAKRVVLEYLTKRDDRGMSLRSAWCYAILYARGTFAYAVRRCAMLCDAV
jgi:hypothetical protein